MSRTQETSVNQVDVAPVREFIERVRRAPDLADREPRVIARWVGGERVL